MILAAGLSPAWQHVIVVDRFRAAGKAIFGPTAAAAQLEGSKSFSKDFMIRAGIPTARYTTVTTVEDAHSDR